jgi:hypothetical protein
VTVEIEMVKDGEREDHLAELMTAFSAVSGPMRGAVMALLAAVREAERLQEEARADLEREKAACDLRIMGLTAESAGLSGTIATLDGENAALRVEWEAVLQVNRALLDEREAFAAVESAIRLFEGRRQAAAAALAAVPLTCIAAAERSEPETRIVKEPAGAALDRDDNRIPGESGKMQPGTGTSDAAEVETAYGPPAFAAAVALLRGMSTGRSSVPASPAEVPFGADLEETARPAPSERPRPASAAPGRLVPRSRRISG